MDRGKFFYQWFKGMLPAEVLEARKWGRDLGKPERKFFSIDDVTPAAFEKAYSSLESKGKPVYQSISYYAAAGKGIIPKPGKLVALEKIFVDLDSEKLEEAREEAKKLYEHLETFATPLIVFSGRKGYHVYVWLPAALEDTALYEYIVKTLGIKKLKLRTLDVKACEPARIARVPYTKHHVSGNYCTPLDRDFKPIDIESFNLNTYIENPLPYSVIREAEELRKAYEEYRAAKKFWLYIEFLKNPWKAFKSAELPEFVSWLLREGAKQGYRNNAAFIIATWLMNKGYPFENVLSELLRWNTEKNKPPLPEKEIENVVKSVFKHRYRPVTRKKALEWTRVNHWG